MLDSFLTALVLVTFVVVAGLGCLLMLERAKVVRLTFSTLMI